ncbi:MAG: hypothetical protein AB7I19_10810 [Planctomycetota bacterium]
MRFARLVAVFLLAFLPDFLPGLHAQRDCRRDSFGLTPLVDLGPSRYRDREGGLYPGGGNATPPAHLAAGLARAAQVVPRDAGGSPSPSGSVVLLAIGMSNTTQEFSTFVPWSNADLERHPAVRVVDGAQGGQDARIFANPNAPAWTVIEQRLAQAGVTPLQVQALWLKEALAAPTSLAWPAHVDELATLLIAVLQNAKARYPNLEVAFLSSRSYGGYSLNPARTEPLSYETGFAIKDVVARQIAGDPALEFDPARGSVRAPWLAWGPYLWADGITVRSDGLQLSCDDYVADGVHPSPSGRLRVADLLTAHFRTHPASVGWYLAAPRAPWAAVVGFGSSCPGTSGDPLLAPRGVPFPGNVGFGLRVSSARPSSLAALLLATDRSRIALGGAGCHLWLDPSGLLESIAGSTSIDGAASWLLPIPADPSLAGFVLTAQAVVIDPLAASFGVAASGGSWLRVGAR